MIQNFPCLRQPGSHACLPTAVGAVLGWLEIGYSPSDLDDWCGVQPGGCDWDDAINGLSAEGFALRELEDFQEIFDFVEDINEPFPVIVTIIPDYQQISSGSDHAVVVVGTSNGMVDYMDPATGNIRQLNEASFRQTWDFAGNRAVVILG